MVDTPLPPAMQAVMDRPAFRHASFGLSVYSLDRHQTVLAHAAEALFTPASTTKLLTEGTALALLGANFRYHTRLYAMAPVGREGMVVGDLVLRASGDPNLSGREQSDGSLAFENEDHAYGGSPDTRAVPGDPLAALRDLARQAVAHGLRRVTGRILVDVSLFPEGEVELGTGTIESPICVNDNIVDVTAEPGAIGQPLRLRISPASRYVEFKNQTITGVVGSAAELHWAQDVVNADLSHTVTVTGSLPTNGSSRLYAYAVPSPSQFAAVALTQVLQDAGVAILQPTGRPAALTMPPNYMTATLVAEHVSAPLAEDVRITLKVSQNLHASMVPLLLGALRGHLAARSSAPADWAQAGFDQEHAFLQQAGLDLSGASQSDGAGGAQAAFFTPDFVTHYLAYFASRKDFPALLAGLPVMGRDGTLFNIQTRSPAAGHVLAKTGTFSAYNALNRTVMVTGKGLAGYFTEPDGRQYAFAFYVNRIAVSQQEDAVTAVVGQALGELAADAYTTLLTPDAAELHRAASPPQ